MIPLPGNYKSLDLWANSLVHQLSRTNQVSPLQLPVYTTSNLPSNARLGTVVLYYDAPEYLPIFSDGTSWRYFDGELV